MSLLLVLHAKVQHAHLEQLAGLRQPICTGPVTVKALLAGSCSKVEQHCCLLIVDVVLARLLSWLECVIPRERNLDVTLLLADRESRLDGRQAAVVPIIQQ